jgi:hypothetical protein
MGKKKKAMSDEEPVRRRVVRQRVVEPSSSHEDSSEEDEDQRLLGPWPKTKKMRLVGNLVSKVCFYIRIFSFASLTYICVYSNRLRTNPSPGL